LAGLLAFGGVCSAWADNGPAAYSLGVFPHLSTARLERVYAPVAADFAAVLEKPVTFRTRTTFAEFAADLDSERYDFALVQPFDYVRINEQHGYLPLARRGEPLFAVFMVLPDSHLHGLEDLRGRVLAMPPETAAVSRLAQVALLDANLDPYRDLTLLHTRAHDACLQQVLSRRADACVTAENPVRFVERRMRVRFRRLARTPEIPHVLFVAHPRVPASERERIRRRILAWPNDPSGRAILEGGVLRKFRPASDADYDTVREYVKRQPGLH
jgi:phosphonate transport system substrate-binding protein